MEQEYIDKLIKKAQNGDFNSIEDALDFADTEIAKITDDEYEDIYIKVEDHIRQPHGISDNGWDEEYFSEILQTINDLDRVKYEIQNAVRGSYGISGDTIEDAKSTLLNYANEIIDNINHL